jgi:hypothetical protein
MQTHRLLSVLLSITCATLTAQQPTPTAPPTPKPSVIPDTFTNLKVLPTTIPKPELMTLMKQFAVTFKVRCSYCHEVSDDLSEGNFASDTKPTKDQARKLITLIHQSTATLKP